MSASDVHVIPMGDMREHLASRACWCMPVLEQAPGDAVVVVHQARDGREWVERHGIN